MVFGIGEGKLEIIINKDSFSPGETISGQIKLSLNSPKKAKELRLLFYGETKENLSRINSGKSRMANVRIFEKKIILDGEKEYPQGVQVYNFELIIPAIKKRESGGGEGVIDSALRFLEEANDPVRNAKWYLDASLDLQMSLDISCKKRINIQL